MSYRRSSNKNGAYGEVGWLLLKGFAVVDDLVHFLFRQLVHGRHVRKGHLQLSADGLLGEGRLLKGRGGLKVRWRWGPDSLPWREGQTLSELLEERDFSTTACLVGMDGATYKPEAFDTTVLPRGAAVKVIRLMSGG